MKKVSEWRMEMRGGMALEFMGVLLIALVVALIQWMKWVTVLPAWASIALMGTLVGFLIGFTGVWFVSFLRQRRTC